jgi:large subunit ribosomal protein L21
MFAIVEIGSQQFKVSKGDKIEVQKLPEEEGKKVTFDKVYLFNDGKKTEVGTPTVKGAVVEAKVLTQKKGEKTMVFKMKPKKRYSKTYGHRDSITELEISDIKKKAATKAAAKPKAEKEEESK